MHLEQCVDRFPADLDTSSFLPRQGRNRQGTTSNVTTQLFPDLKFGCNGTIVRLRAAAMNRGGQQSPKIQVWRESKNQSGEYYKEGPDIPLTEDDSKHVCVRDHHRDKIFRCSLNETFQVSIQPGDILGLELPPQSDINFDISFKPGDQLSYVFEGQLDCTGNISEAVHQRNGLPQINLVVMLGHLVITVSSYDIML